MAGLGIAVMPTFLAGPAIDRGELVVLLPDYAIPEAGMYVVRPPPAEPVAAQDQGADRRDGRELRQAGLGPLRGPGSGTGPWSYAAWGETPLRVMSIGTEAVCVPIALCMLSFNGSRIRQTSEPSQRLEQRA